MHQTRQFTKRRAQSPMMAQNQAHDGLQPGAKANLPRSGLAIQSSAPIHTRTFTEQVEHKSDHSYVVNDFNSITHSVQQDVHHLDHDHHDQSLNLNQDHSRHIPVSANNLNYSSSHGHGIDSLDHSQHAHNHQDHSPHDHSPHDHSHHDHSLHDPSQHDHSHRSHNPDHHGHDHHSHDHHGHNHHGHNHHGHNHHGHDHHGHGHGHSHDHHHNFPQVYTQPLPSYSSIFATLAPPQKALFTFFIGYAIIGMVVYSYGAANESLAVIGFAYLTLFDAFGILNNFVSSVLKYNHAFTTSSTKRPFGVKRFEVVFGFANTIFLLFGTMFTTKESLEHLLADNHHTGDHNESKLSFGLLFVVLLAIGASFGSSVKLGNHDNLINLTKKSSQYDNSYNEKMGFIMETPIQQLKKNIYSLSIVATGSIIFLFHLFGLTTGSMDKCVAFGEAGLMLYLGGPTATALAVFLLQTKPDNLQLDYYIRQLKEQIPSILSIDKIHFWQNEYGQLIGTLDIQTRNDVDEDYVISQCSTILEPLIKEGELSVSVSKNHK